MVKKPLGSIITLVVAFLFVIVLLIVNNSPWWFIALMAVLAVVFVLFNGRRGRHTPWVDAKSRVGSDHAVVFWKPGCMFCERLLMALGKDSRVTWVNVWADEDANAEVRRLNNGDELTPTAVVGDRVLRNPSARELLESLSG